MLYRTINRPGHYKIMNKVYYILKSGLKKDKIKIMRYLIEIFQLW